MTITLQTDPFPADQLLNDLFTAVWGQDIQTKFKPILERSLAHVGAFDDDILVGFINVAWDGGAHAFILDTSVHPEWRRRGIATALVQKATTLARDRGAEWLHVDFEPHLTKLYTFCGFRATKAGLIQL